MKLHRNFWEIVLGVLSLTVIGLSIWFIIDLRSLYKTGELHPTRGFSRSYINRPTMNVIQIQSWMTFSYVNYIYKLPVDYLKDSLSINDTHYPNLEISKYAKSKKLDVNTFLADIRTAVLNFNTSAQ